MKWMTLQRASAALCVLAAAIGALFSPIAAADEILLHDGSWLTAMVDSVSAEGRLRLRLVSGDVREVAVEDVIAIYMKGREPRSIRSGMQEFRLVSGDRIRGEILGLKNDDLLIRSHATGELPLAMGDLEGFVALPQIGRSGRRAEQLLADPSSDPAGFADEILDRRSTTYEGVIENITEKTLTVDHENMMQALALPVLYLAGVRLADRERRKAFALPTKLFLRARCRDGTTVDGYLEKVELGRWHLRPLSESGKMFALPVEELVLIEVLNGRTLYLSQPKPVAVEEKTELAPACHYRMNANCFGNRLVIGEQEYLWGIGVHASSSLTFDLSRQFEVFHASIGVDKQAGRGGSVTFAVLGDGKELFKSPVLRGGEAARKIAVPVAGVSKLTLVVGSAGDMDLGDCADWAMARLVRQGGAAKTAK
jgi:hypothetical protein